MTTGHVAEAPRTHIKSEVVVARGGFKIVRLAIPADEGLPPHRAEMDVAIVVVSGEGHITVAGKTYPAEPGAVIAIPPGATHGVFAVEPLDILVIQA